MAWYLHVTRPLTDGQFVVYTYLAIGLLAATGSKMAATLWHRRSGRPVAPQRPYDWASDPQFRQAVTVRRRAS